MFSFNFDKNGKQSYETTRIVYLFDFTAFLLYCEGCFYANLGDLRRFFCMSHCLLLFLFRSVFDRRRRRAATSAPDK